MPAPLSSPPPAPVLDLRDLTVVRGKTPILTGIRWRVEPGEHWVILGANGSGKTSLLSALTGYLTPSGGELSVLGERYGASNWPELRRKIGIVSSAVRQQMHDEEPALLTVLSGKAAMIGHWGRMSAADREQARQILAQIDAAHLARRPWRVLSQGERQRVLMGRALMARPRLLILDEPCAGLDPVARRHFLRFIERLAAGNLPGGKACGEPMGELFGEPCEAQRGNGCGPFAESGNRAKRGPLAREKASPQPTAATPAAAPVPCPTLLLVTHHVEEIVPGFTHVLALKKGQVLTAAPREKALTSKMLSELFGEPVRLLRRQGRPLLEPGKW